MTFDDPTINRPEILWVVTGVRRLEMLRRLREGDVSIPPAGSTANKLCCWPIGRRQNNWPPNSSKEDDCAWNCHDHGGFGLKEELLLISSAGMKVVRFGRMVLNPETIIPTLSSRLHRLSWRER